MIGGLAPQPRLLWAVGIGAGLIALAIVSPVLGFVAVIYHAGLVIIATRDLALLPGGSGYFVRRGQPRPFPPWRGEVPPLRWVNTRAPGPEPRRPGPTAAPPQPPPPQAPRRLPRTRRPPA